MLGSYREESGHELLDVLDVIQVLRQRVRHVDTNHLPIRLALE